MRESVISIVSPRTGSDELVDHDGCPSRTDDPVGCVSDGCPSRTDDPVGCVSTRWPGRVEGDDCELIIYNVDSMTVDDVCLSEMEGPVMWEYGDGVVSPWTGSDIPFGDHEECDAFESIGRVLGTYINGVCLSEPGDPDVTGESVGCVST